MATPRTTHLNLDIVSKEQMQQLSDGIRGKKPAQKSYPQSPKIGIPKERLLQLKELSDALNGATMSATIGKLLEWAREQGKVEHGIPGVKINALSDGVVITLEGSKPVGFKAAQAALFAKSIKAMADGSEQSSTLVNVDDNWMLDRRGPNGVKVSLPINADPKPFASDIILEFADLVERAIAGVTK